MYQRYFIGFLLTIGLIVLLILLLFHGGGNSKPKVQNTSKPLDSYATTGASVSMIVDGPITVDQDHEQIRINVTSDSTTFEHIKGYQGNVVGRQSYPNNVNSFTNFLFGLERAGFTQGDKTSSLKDERGYCPLGDRYIFELQQDGQDVERYWITSCGGTKTYNGIFDTTQELFQRQIPNYTQLTENINL